MSASADAHKLIKNCSAVLFDFDGLIFDSEWVAFESWSRVYHEHEAQLKIEEFVQCVGSSDDLFNPAQNLIDKQDLKVTAKSLIAKKNSFKKSACKELMPFAGVVAFIEALESDNADFGFPKQKMIVSSSHNPWVEQNLKSLGLKKHFKETTTGDEVEQVKPAPDLYLLAAKRLGVKPKDCLVFEDSQNGLVAAKAAGMSCIVVPNRITANSDFKDADVRLATFQELEF